MTLPAFDFQTVIIDVWTRDLDIYGWIILMAFLVATSCGLIGNYLVLRRLSLVGDAISHSVLPGIVIAFLVAGSLAIVPMFIGALIAGLVTTVLIEFIHSRSRIKQDAAIGVTFSTLFAIGVILVSVMEGTSHIDIDPDCVLYGHIDWVADADAIHFGSMEVPKPVFIMGLVTVVSALLIIFFYKELLITSFDPNMATSVGISPKALHYGLMSVLSVIIVSAFEAVGAILVIAMLIIPACTASLLTQRLPIMLILSGLHAAFSAIAGVHLAIWLDCNIAGSIVVAGSFLFVLAWVFSPHQGLLQRALKRRQRKHSEAIPEIP